ncbi:MAG: COQ9 family protein [Rhodospirillaceae bacterium]
MSHAAEKTAARDAVIQAALPNVPFDGWTQKVLSEAAVSAGHAGAVPMLFPAGASDAVAHFMDMADRAMVADLKAQDLSILKVRAKVALGVRLRLERWTPHREAVRRALALSPHPAFAGKVLRNWYAVVDAIWRAAGDRSVDFNFYTKRGLLAAVYGATVLYWLDDRSEGCAATWTFLDRRIEDVMQVPKIKSQIAEGLKALPNPFRIAGRVMERFRTAR